MNTVAELVGTTLAGLGVGHAFGVVGSGNFHVTNALRAAGVPFVAARHEGGRRRWPTRGRARPVGPPCSPCTRGCGLTNAVTGVAEAAKSRTPLLVLAADTGAAAAVQLPHRPERAGHGGGRGGRARALARLGGRGRGPRVPDGRRAAPHGRAQPAAGRAGRPRSGTARRRPCRSSPRSGRTPGRRRACRADRGRGAPGARRRAGCAVGRARAPVARRGVGALLATSAVAHGLFAGDPWGLGIFGGFALPLAVELIQDADLVVGWGCALNMWTTRHGTPLGAGARVVQVDLDADALGAHRPVDLGVLGDVGATAADVLAVLAPRTGYRTDAVRAAIAQRGAVARRAVRRPHRAGRHRPPDAVDRPGRPAAPGPDGGRRLRQLHGLPGRLPGGPRRGRVLLHPGVPVDRAGAGDGDRARWPASTAWPWPRWATVAR